MKLVFPKGTTSRIVTVFIQANNVTTGAGLSGLTNASSIVGGYVREGSTGVALAVDEDVTTEGTYQAPSAAGKVRIGTPANMRAGTYELHFHNDLWATGAEGVVITLGGASNMADLPIEVQLSDPVRGLGAPTALPDAAADAAGGLPISDAGGLDLDSKIGALTYGTANRVNAQVYGMEANVITTASIADGAYTAVKFAADLLTAIQNGLATAAELAKVPKSDGTASWNATALASIQTKVADALAAAYLTPIRTGTVTSGDTPTTTSFTSDITDASNFWHDRIIEFISGPLTGQSLPAHSYSLAGGRFEFDEAWTAAPEVGDQFIIRSGAHVHSMTAIITGVFNDALVAAAWQNGSFGKLFQDNINATIGSRASQASLDTVDDLLDTEIPALTSELAKVPKSDSNVTFNATAAAQFQSEATDALNAYDPPTRTEATADKDEILSGIAALPTDADVNTQVDQALVDVGLTTTVTGRIDAAISTRATPAQVTAAVPTAIENADALLDRNMATGTDSGSPTVRTPRQAFRALRNKVTTAGGLSVKKEDDTTESWAATLTTDAAAEPITVVDPA